MEKYPKRESGPAAFDLSGGHPALDLVNTLDDRFDPDGPLELLADYGDLLRFARQAKLLDPRQAKVLARTVSADAGRQVLRSARELREALARALYGTLEGRPPAAGDVAALERHFHHANRQRKLRWQSTNDPAGGAAMSWHWDGNEPHAELPLWMLAAAASRLLLADGLHQVRACGAETCRWLFLDTSKNHTRRWCNMKVCGNRMKARRFHARRVASL